ncbi:MAG: hypothetical protein WD270_08520 [Acetobacterales bacterium]
MTGVGTSIVFAPLVPVWLLIAFGAAALLVVAFAAWRRARGTVLRSAAIAVLLGLLANPSLKEELREPLTDIAVIVVDESASQKIEPRPGHTQEIVDELQARLAREQSLEARVVRAGKPETANAASGQPPRDRGTRLFDALTRTMGDIAPQRFAGAIMVTDGQVHDVPADPRGQGISGPVHGILTGTRNLRDRRLVIEQAATYGIVGESATITLRIEESGGGSGQAPVKIARDGADTRTLDLTTDFSHSIDVDVENGGPNVFEIEVAPAEGELTLANNRAAVVVNGVRDRLRVLLVSGLPHAGERVWRNLLKADPSVDLVHFTILRPPEKQDGTPVNELSLIAFPTRELFEEKLEDFDLIIFDRYHRRGVLPVNYLNNIVRYVEDGGAILEAGGPALATPLGLFRTPLREILPTQPTGQVIEQPFRAQISDIGHRHPVTAELPGAENADGSRAAPPNWGRWFRLVEAEKRRGRVVMESPEGKPVLALDRAGEGRIAQLLTDQIWLWARGFDGGGPQAELLRRTAHWLMKEPDLEEEDLRATIQGTRLMVTRQSLEKDERPVTVETPSGERSDLALTDGGNGKATGAMTVAEPGLYRIIDQEKNKTVFAAAGALNPVEFADVTTSEERLAPAAKATGGGLFWYADGMPDIRRPQPDRATSGRGWLGLRANGDYIVRGVNEIPLLPALLALLLALGVMVWAWRREGN